jgi:hypothetical protein
MIAAGVILNKTAPELIQSGIMQTIKGLIALLLVAAGVFTAVVIFNGRTGPGHEAVVEKSAVAGTDKPVKQPGIGNTTSAVSHRTNPKNSL